MFCLHQTWGPAGHAGDVPDCLVPYVRLPAVLRPSQPRHDLSGRLCTREVHFALSGSETSHVLCIIYRLAVDADVQWRQPQTPDQVNLEERPGRDQLSQFGEFAHNLYLAHRATLP